MDLLLSFCNFNSVYFNLHHPGKFDIMNMKLNGYKEIKIFKDKNINIVKIALGGINWFFLDDSGIVWVCGSASAISLGYDNIYNNMYKNIDVLTQITYFIKHGIKIKDIQCGCKHSLALSVDDNIYSWGENTDAQCGFDHKDFDYISEPKRIEFFDDFIIDKIKAGWKHNYIATECGKHYMFGSNYYNECITFDDKRKIVVPHKINEIVKSKCGIHCIIDVVPSRYDTIIIAMR